MTSRSNCPCLTPYPHRTRDASQSEKWVSPPCFCCCFSLLCEHSPWQQLFPFFTLRHADVRLPLVRSVFQRVPDVVTLRPVPSAVPCARPSSSRTRCPAPPSGTPWRSTARPLSPRACTTTRAPRPTTARQKVSFPVFFAPPVSTIYIYTRTNKPHHSPAKSEYGFRVFLGLTALNIREALLSLAGVVIVIGFSLGLDLWPSARKSRVKTRPFVPSFLLFLPSFIHSFIYSSLHPLQVCRAATSRTTLGARLGAGTSSAP